MASTTTTTNNGKKSPKIHVRPAQLSDFPQTADIALAGFSQDELFDFTNPYKDKYPQDFRDWHFRQHRLRYWLPGFVVQVAVLEDTDTEDHEAQTVGGVGEKESGSSGNRDGERAGEKVVGFAIWYRFGESEVVKKRWRWKGWRACMSFDFSSLVFFPCLCFLLHLKKSSALSISSGVLGLYGSFLSRPVWVTYLVLCSARVINVPF